MKILYLDCGMGVAGDMLTASLIDTLEEPTCFVEIFNVLGIPGVKMGLTDTKTCGIRGKRVRVLVHGREKGDHKHESDSNTHDLHELRHAAYRKLEDIMQIIDALDISEGVCKNSKEIYRSIAEAESKVHQTNVGEVHFHELGAMDTVADVVAFCLLIDMIEPDEISASPVNVGQGHIRCAHGILPVPAPATAELLKGIPSYGGDFEGELCTPTGAALLKHFAIKFGPQPLMTVSSVGYGVGTREFAAANCVRAFIGGQY